MVDGVWPGQSVGLGHWGTHPRMAARRSVGTGHAYRAAGGRGVVVERGHVDAYHGTSRRSDGWMGHHRRTPPAGGLIGWLTHWWHRGQVPAQEANRKALAALSDAK